MSVPVSSLWIVALFAGVAIATLALFALVVLAAEARPGEKAKLYTLPQRASNVTEATPPAEYRKSA